MGLLNTTITRKSDSVSKTNMILVSYGDWEGNKHAALKLIRF